MRIGTPFLVLLFFSFSFLFDSLILAADPPINTVPASQRQKKPPANSTSFLQQAWRAYTEKNYETANRAADDLIANFDVKAKQLQQSLKEPFPLKAVNQYWALNDVATAKLIKAKILIDTGNDTKAKEILGDIIDNYFYAMSYDPRGYYWSVSEAAKKIVGGEGQTRTGESTSSAFITSQAWRAYNDKELQASIDQAMKCSDLYLGPALVQQKQYSKPPEGEQIKRNWAMNDVGTCFYIAGMASYDIGDWQKARYYFNFIKSNLKYANCRDESQGGYWSVADAAAKKLAEMDKNGGVQ